jgi:hypothetical protein
LFRFLHLISKYSIVYCLQVWVFFLLTWRLLLIMMWYHISVF